MENYLQICHILEPGDYSVEFHMQTRSPMIVRHDVDRFPTSAVAIAVMEFDYGIRSTYYFRYHGDDSEFKYIETIAKLGHEIGFHYETLYKCSGDPEWAVRMFRDQLRILRQVAEIKTVCPHGSQGYRNHKIMSDDLLFQNKLLGDAYINIRFGELDYYSDSGDKWHVFRKQANLLDNPDKIKLESNQDEVIKAIQSGDNVYIATHPQYWV